MITPDFISRLMSIPFSLALAVTTSLLGLSTRTAMADDFFAGKTISIVVGSSAGGGYDLYARVLSKYMGRYLPGQPKIVTQNMPGAGGLRAATYLYKVAPQDGTTLGTFLRGNIIGSLFGQSTIDATKYNWVGSVTDDVNICISWHTSKIKTWADMQREVFTVAGQGPGAYSNVYANLVKNLFNVPIRIVSGYPGSNEMGIAMERGEVDGVCTTSYGTARTAYRDKLRNKQFNFLFQAGLRKVPELPDVPMLPDLAHGDRERAILRFVIGILGASRPFAAPPGVPEERVRLLRDAFMKTMKDAEFLADAVKFDMEIHPLDGASVNALIDGLYRTPKDVIEQTKQFFLQ